MKKYYESKGVEKFLPFRQLMIDQEAITKFREAVEIFGAGKWSKISHHLAVHHGIHLPHAHLSDFWIKLNQEHKYAGDTRHIKIQIGIEVIEKNFNVDQVTLYREVLVTEYAKEALNQLRRVIAVMIRAFIREKQKFRGYYSSPYPKCRLSAFRDYIQLLEVTSSDKQVQRMQRYAAKFKIISLTILKQCRGESRISRFTILKDVTFRNECEIILNDLAYICEILKIQDGSITKDQEIYKISNICPNTIREIKSSEVYKIIQKPKNGADIKMFEIYQQHQNDIMQEDKAQLKYCINPFDETPIPSKLNTTIIIKPPKRPSLKQLKPNYKTLHFTNGVVQDLAEQDAEDSLEEIPIQTLQSAIPILQKQPQMDKYQQAILRNPMFEEFAKEKLKQHQEQVYQEFMKAHGAPI